LWATPYDALRALASDPPKPAKTQLLGGSNEPFLVQQLAAWSDTGADPEWMYMSQIALKAESMPSDDQQLRLCNNLSALV
jgi:hypothetical protein